MKLTENSFYVLGVTTRDNGKTINERAEELSLFNESGIVNNARMILTNPQYRLEAEIHWFPGVAPSRIAKIIEKLNVGEGLNLINSGIYYGLSKINILMDIISRGPINKDTLQQLLVNTVNEYNDTNLEEIISNINNDREVSGFPLVKDKNKIEQLLKKLKAEVQSEINKRAKELPPSHYSDLAKDMVTKYMKDSIYDSLGILDDFLDSYELDNRKNLEDIIDKIQSVLDEIDNQQSLRTSHYEELVSLMIKFNKIAIPVQINMASKGLVHEGSQTVLSLIRNMAVKLHNEYNQTQEAIRLSKLLREYCINIPSAMEQIDTDIQTLEKFIRDEREFQLYLDRMERNEKTGNIVSRVIGWLIVLGVFAIIRILSSSV